MKKYRYKFLDSHVFCRGYASYFWNSPVFTCQLTIKNQYCRDVYCLHINHFSIPHFVDISSFKLQFAQKQNCDPTSANEALCGKINFEL